MLGLHRQQNNAVHDMVCQVGICLMACVSTPDVISFPASCLMAAVG